MLEKDLVAKSRKWVLLRRTGLGYVSLCSLLMSFPMMSWFESHEHPGAHRPKMVRGFL